MYLLTYLLISSFCVSNALSKLQVCYPRHRLSLVIVTALCSCPGRRKRPCGKCPFPLIQMSIGCGRQSDRQQRPLYIAFYVVRFQNSRPDQLNDVTVKLRLHLFDVLCFGFVVQQIETSGVWALVCNRASWGCHALLNAFNASCSKLLLFKGFSARAPECQKLKMMG